MGTNKYFLSQANPDNPAAFERTLNTVQARDRISGVEIYKEPNPLNVIYWGGSFILILLLILMAVEWK